MWHLAFRHPWVRREWNEPPTSLLNSLRVFAKGFFYVSYWRVNHAHKSVDVVVEVLVEVGHYFETASRGFESLRVVVLPRDFP